LQRAEGGCKELPLHPVAVPLKQASFSNRESWVILWDLLPFGLDSTGEIVPLKNRLFSDVFFAFCKKKVKRRVCLFLGQCRATSTQTLKFSFRNSIAKVT
jgi:hypothetical protein